MNETKVLFADLYRLIGSIRESVKEMAKKADKLLTYANWEDTSFAANDLMTDAAQVEAVARMIRGVTAQFISDGPYIGESAGVTPLENWAREG